GTKAPKLAREELIDVLHFFIEICILTAANSLDIFTPLSERYIDGERVDPLVVWMGTLPAVELFDSWHKPLNEMVFYLLSSGHTLKNKPWKQTLKPTDMNLFYKYLRSAFYSYLRTAH